MMKPIIICAFVSSSLLFSSIFLLLCFHRPLINHKVKVPRRGQPPVTLQEGRP